MRFYGVALAASALVLGACGGGGDNKAADTATPPAATGGDTAAGGAGAAPAPGGAATMAAVTGTTHEVKMIGDDKGYRFEPANLTVKAGDGVRFTMVSGGPHNVAFDAASVPADVKAQLDANISEKGGELASAMKMNPNETITVSFANIKPGTYSYNCTPHLAMGMKGQITVQ